MLRRCEVNLQCELISRVKGKMFDLDMSQSELACRVGVSTKHLNRMLQGADAGALTMWDSLLNELDRELAAAKGET